MSVKRQKNQQMAFRFEEGSEAPGDVAEGIEALRAVRDTESPALSQQLMEEIFEQENVGMALKQVRANQGSPGIDGMTVDELPEYLKERWPAIRESLLRGDLCAATGKTG